MKVTVCQIDPREDQLDQYMTALAEHAREKDSQFILLPEMGLSDWLVADQTPCAQKWYEAVQQHEARMSRFTDMGVPAILGTRPIIKDQGSRRNQAYIWQQDTNQASAIREKYYLPDEEGYWEHSWYERGPLAFDVARALDMRIGVQICTEMWFFEWARHYAASRIDILCIPRATPHESVDKWLAGGRAAAVTSGAYSLSSNLWCPKGSKANCGGLSWVVDPEGNILATTNEQDPFATVEIDLDFSKISKTTYPRNVPE